MRTLTMIATLCVAVCGQTMTQDWDLQPGNGWAPTPDTLFVGSILDGTRVVTHLGISVANPPEVPVTWMTWASLNLIDADGALIPWRHDICKQPLILLYTYSPITSNTEPHFADFGPIDLDDELNILDQAAFVPAAVGVQVVYSGIYKIPGSATGMVSYPGPVLLGMM